MGYENLTDIYYKDGKNYEEIYQTRFTSPGTVKFPLYIKTRNDNNYQLFLVQTPEVVQLLEEIGRKTNRRFCITGYEVPMEFFHNYIIKLMFDEIKTTNEIEGVHTKKEDLEKVFYNCNDSAKKFRYIVQKYGALISEEQMDISLQAAEDFRTLYDELLMDDIKPKHAPDGKLFRQRPAAVYRSGEKTKPIHKGIPTEEGIIDALNNLLLFVNDGQESYLQVAVAHYYMAYVYPFYEGNGRLARFLASDMLFRRHDQLLALKLSKKIKDNIRHYEDVFANTNHEHNRGDMTPFVLMYLQLLNEACDEINAEVSMYVTYLEQMQGYIQHDRGLKNAAEKAIIFFLYQGELIDKKISVKEIAKHIDKSEEATRKYVKALESRGYIRRGAQGKKHCLFLSQQTATQIDEYFYTDAKPALI